jgi:hypothetical protein
VPVLTPTVLQVAAIEQEPKKIFKPIYGLIAIMVFSCGIGAWYLQSKLSKVEAPSAPPIVAVQSDPPKSVVVEPPPKPVVVEPPPKPVVVEPPSKPTVIEPPPKPTVIEPPPKPTVIEPPPKPTVIEPPPKPTVIEPPPKPIASSPVSKPSVQEVNQLVNSDASPERLYLLGLSWKQKGHLAEAFLVLDAAANRGHANAALTLGEMFDPSVPERPADAFPTANVATAAKWYKVAKQQGAIVQGQVSNLSKFLNSAKGGNPHETAEAKWILGGISGL